MDHSEIYQNFLRILDERCSRCRKTCNSPLNTYSFKLVEILASMGEPSFLVDMIAEKIDIILSDCEIFHGMNREQAMDTVLELSNWAALFVSNQKYDHLYVRICGLIDSLLVSY